MDARTLDIRTIFGQERRHVVPLFQRPYVWTRENQWEPLWADIQRVAERGAAGSDTRGHFLGAIVLDQVRKPTGHVDTRLIIDGQQRLITLQLLIQAFCDLCEAIGQANHAKALGKFTRNDDPLSDDPDEVFKVWPTNADRTPFRDVMRAGSAGAVRATFGKKPGVPEVGHSIGDAYLYFSETVQAWLRPEEEGFDDRLRALFEAIRANVRMVVIDLSEKDDAQVIFETLNARGEPLLPADLVKNFLFHRAQLEGKNIEALYRAYWEPFDMQHEYWRQLLGRGHARRARIDTFLQHYLTLRTGDEVPVSNLYTTFRDFFSENGEGDASTQLSTFREYAEVYRGFDGFEPGSREARFFERLTAMETTTAYPFLLELFVQDAEQPDSVHAVLGDIESFLVRRLVCQLSTRGYNRLFLDLLLATRDEKGTPAQRVRDFLLSSDAESSRWPGDQEFLEAWVEAPLFRTLKQSRVRMLLEGLERQLYDPKSEALEFGEKLTIEHLLPQEWKKHWPLLSDVPLEEAEHRRGRVLHTMGNLTLLTKHLNPAMSNGPWVAKRQEILRRSALSLNRPLAELAVWDERAIEERGRALFKVACQVWPHPTAKK